MEQGDPFAGLGKALKRLRKRAGFQRQIEAAAALKLDSGQLSRWENEVPRPSLENLGRVLAGYGATVADLAEELGAVAMAQPAEASDEAQPEELIRALVETMRRVEGRQMETENRVDRIERGLQAATQPALPHPRAGEG